MSGKPPAPENALLLERILGFTALHNAGLASDCNGNIAYPAGCMVVVYNSARNKQVHYFRAGRPVTCVSFSKDGRYLAAGERAQAPSVLVWDMETGNLMAQLQQHRHGVSALSFTSDGSKLVTAGFKSDATVHIWDWSAGERLGSARLDGKVFAVDAAEDGSCVVAAGECGLQFFPFRDGAPRLAAGLRVEGAPGLLHSEAVLHELSGSTFVDVRCGTGASAGMVFAVTPTGTVTCVLETRVLDRYVAAEASDAFAITCADHMLAVACTDGIVRLFAAATLEYVTTLPSPPALGAANVAPSQDAVRLSLASFSAGARYPHALCARLSADASRCTVVYADRTLFVWDVRDPRRIGKLRTFLFPGACVWDVAAPPAHARLGPAPGLAYGSGSGRDPRNGAVSSPLPRDSFITCGSDGSVRIWSLDAARARSKAADDDDSGGPSAPRPAPNMDARSRASWQCAFSRELLHIVYVHPPRQRAPGEASVRSSGGGMAGKAEAGNLAEDCERPAGPDHDTTLRCLTVDGRGRHVAVGDRKGTVRVYDMMTQGVAATLAAHDKEVLALAFAPPEAGPAADTPARFLATASRDRLVHLFHCQQSGYAHAGTAEHHTSSVTGVRFSPDGTRLVSCGGDRALAFSAVLGSGAPPADAQPLCPALGRTTKVSVKGKVFDVDVDPGGRLAVTAGQERVSLWQLDSGRAVRHYRPVDASSSLQLNKAVVDPGGLYVATAAFDKSIRLFDFVSGHQVAKVGGHSELVTGLAFTQDGRRLISVGGDGCIFVWRLAKSVARAIGARVKAMRQRASPAPALASPPQRRGHAPVRAVHDALGEGESEGKGAGVSAAPEGASASSPSPTHPTQATSPGKGDTVKARHAFESKFRKSALPVWAQPPPAAVRSPGKGSPDASAAASAAADPAAHRNPGPAEGKLGVPPLRAAWAAHGSGKRGGGGGVEEPTKSAREALLSGTDASSLAATLEDRDDVLVGVSSDEEEEEGPGGEGGGEGQTAEGNEDEDEEGADAGSTGSRSTVAGPEEGEGEEEGAAAVQGKSGAAAEGGGEAEAEAEEVEDEDDYGDEEEEEEEPGEEEDAVYFETEAGEADKARFSVTRMRGGVVTSPVRPQAQAEAEAGTGTEGEGAAEGEGEGEKEVGQSAAGESEPAAPAPAPAAAASQPKSGSLAAQLGGATGDRGGGGAAALRQSFSAQFRAKRGSAASAQPQVAVSEPETQAEAPQVDGSGAQEALVPPPPGGAATAQSASPSRSVASTATAHAPLAGPLPHREVSNSVSRPGTRTEAATAPIEGVTASFAALQGGLSVRASKALAEASGDEAAAGDALPRLRRTVGEMQRASFAIEAMASQVGMARASCEPADEGAARELESVAAALRQSLLDAHARIGRAVAAVAQPRTGTVAAGETWARTETDAIPAGSSTSLRLPAASGADSGAAVDVGPLLEQYSSLLMATLQRQLQTAAGASRHTSGESTRSERQRAQPDADAEAE